MKAIQIKDHNGDKSILFASDIHSAIEHYESQLSLDIKSIKEIPQKKWHKIDVNYYEDNDPIEGEHFKSNLLKEALSINRKDIPIIIVSTFPFD